MPCLRGAPPAPTRDFDENGNVITDDDGGAQPTTQPYHQQTAPSRLGLARGRLSSHQPSHASPHRKHAQARLCPDTHCCVFGDLLGMCRPRFMLIVHPYMGVRVRVRVRARARVCACVCACVHGRVATCWRIA